jgi:excisionase family DNA binding protein
MDEEIKKFAEIVANKAIICTKDVLTSDEAANYLGISKGSLYQMTMKNRLPFYRPSGRTIYFDRKELQDWMKQNRVSTKEELNAKAESYCISKKGR